MNEGVVTAIMVVLAANAIILLILDAAHGGNHKPKPSDGPSVMGWYGPIVFVVSVFVIGVIEWFIDNFDKVGG